ncbi:C2 domain-containing protein [Entamoeba marina]
MTYNIILNITSAIDLSADITGVDSFVSFKVPNQEKVQTRTYPKSLNPFWCEDFEFLIDKGEELAFKISNVRTVKNTIGTAQYTMEEFKANEKKTIKLPIKSSGVLTIKITCLSVK